MRLAGVSYRYGRRGPWVLRGVDLTVEPGQVAVVLGRNGAGKSTLLQIAAGVLRPSAGAVLDRAGPVGWVPERFPADQPFTVVDYLDAMARVGGGGEPGPWIERLGLTPYVRTKLGELSKGTAQKVGLAQALLRSPKLLVLDEPWEGLDAAARALVPDMVAEVTAAGGAVLVSDHRGETARLPDATMWTVADGGVTATSEADVLAPTGGGSGGPKAGAGAGIPKGSTFASATGTKAGSSPLRVAGRDAGALDPAEVALRSDLSPVGDGMAEAGSSPLRVAGRDAAALDPAEVALRSDLSPAGAGRDAAGLNPAEATPRADRPPTGSVDGHVVVEVRVPAGRADDAVAELRAAGHEVVRVRSS